MQSVTSSRLSSSLPLLANQPAAAAAKAQVGHVFKTTNALPAIITGDLKAEFHKSHSKAAPADMSEYFVIATEQQNRKRVKGEQTDIKLFKGNEFLQDAQRFLDPLKPKVFHKAVDGYVGMDGHVYTPRMTVNDEDNLHAAMRKLTGDNPVSSVVALPVAKNHGGEWMLNVHRHQEEETDWGYKQDFIATPGGLVTGKQHDPKSILSTLYQELNEETGFTEPKQLNIKGMMFDHKAKVMYFVVATPALIPESAGSAPPQAGYSPFFNRLKPNEEYSDPAVQTAAAQGKIICAARQDGKFDLSLSRNMPLNLKDAHSPLVELGGKDGRGISVGLAQDKLLGRFNMFMNADVRDLLVNAL